jgi:hypothetical protein
MRIGIVGAGMIGSTVAKLWADAGHEVMVSSRHPNELESLVEQLGKEAAAGTPDEAARFGEVVLITVPLKVILDLARQIGADLVDKVVLDTGNAHEQRDGDLAREATRYNGGSAGWAASKFPRARWVKAFNSVYYQTLRKEAHRRQELVGIPLAGDDPDALQIASQLVRDAGFEPVVVGRLLRGKEFEPGTAVYNTGMSASDLRRAFTKHDGAAASESPRAST